MSNGPLIFSGNANRPLAEAIAGYLGLDLGNVLVTAFPDHEIQIDFRQTVRDSDVYLIQPTCAPVNDHWMELLLMIDAARRVSARRITAVIPYYGYSRQEKISKGREPISARLMGKLLNVAGVDRGMVADLTNPAIVGFFDFPVDALPVGRILADYCLEHLGLAGADVLSPDAGWVEPTGHFGNFIGAAGMSAVLKYHPDVGATGARGMVGDVRGKRVVIVDDMISTGSTTIQAAELALEKGATEVYACAAHPVFASGAVERLEESPIKKVVVTDSIPLPPGASGGKIAVVSIAPVLAEAIRCSNAGLPMSAIYRYLRGESDDAPWAGK